MKLEQAHIDQIRADFELIVSKQDLLVLLNKVKPFVYGEKAVPFELKQLTWFANPKLCNKRYTKFNIKKKSGAIRTIHAPVRGLKSIQKTLSFVLQCVFEPHKAAMGFVWERSIVDNAKLHAGSKYVYNIDLKDFFPSIDQARVWKCLQLKPFNLKYDEKTDWWLDLNGRSNRRRTPIFTTNHGENILYKLNDGNLSFIPDNKGNWDRYVERLTGHIPTPDSLLNQEETEEVKEYITQLRAIIREDAWKYVNEPENIKQRSRVETRQSLAGFIASLCCTEMLVERKSEAGEWEKVNRNVLPQGAPTSPVITNIVCQKLDFLLSGVAKRFGLKYSRYADDITFSSMHNVYQLESDFLKELHRIIIEQGFHIKESKTRLQKEAYRQEVTGLVVNEKANVQQRYIKQLRMWLYYWERYGYERAYGYFVEQYLEDKGHLSKGKPNMANIISGKLDFLKMVRGEEDGVYVKLRGRFDSLTEKQSDITNILDIWEKSGIDAAMDEFYSKNQKS